MSEMLYHILLLVLLIGFIADWITNRKNHPVRSLIINTILAVVLLPILYYEIANSMKWDIILDFMIGITIGYKAAEAVDTINNTEGDENEHTP